MAQRVLMATLGPVNVYSLTVTIPAGDQNDRYPQDVDISDDRFFRLYRSNGVQFQKNEVLNSVEYSVGWRALNINSEVNLWRRFIRTTEETDVAANLQAMEQRATSTAFWSPFAFEQIVAPGVQMSIDTSVGEADIAMSVELLLYESLDVNNLIPFLGGPSPFQGVASAFGVPLE